MSGSDVDNWSEDNLYKWTGEHNINADKVVSVTELRMLVRAHLSLAKGNDEEERSSVSTDHRRPTVITKRSHG